MSNLSTGRPLPLIGVLLGCAVLAAGAVIVPRVMPALPLSMLLGGGALAGAALWIVALLAGLRSGPFWWIVASLALLLVGGTVAGYGAGRIDHARMAGDASAFAELETNPDGTPILPGNPARGPISSAYVEMVRSDERDAKEDAARMGQLKLGTLNSPYLLAQAPALLSDCGAILNLEPATAKGGERRAQRSAALMKQIEESQFSSELKRGITMIASPLPGPADPLLAQDRAMLDATHKLCQLLARRTWSNANGLFGFGSGADRAAFDAIDARRRAVEGERTRIRREIKQRFEAGREIVRTALS